MAKATGKEAIKNQVVKDMKELKIYKKQYNRLIEIYAELVDQYNTISMEFEAGGFQYEVYTAEGGSKKAPIVATLETLRKDILAYSDRLCLNPKALESVKTDTGAKKSALASVLKGMS